MRIINYFFLLFFVASTIWGFEKVGTTSFQFLKVMTTARAYSMGGAYTTLANSSDAVYWNPAGLTKVNNFSVSAGYADWFMDVGQFSISTAYSIENMGTFGLFAQYSDIGSIEETSVSALGFVDGVYNPGLTGRSFSPTSFVVGFSYAKDLNDRFSFGVNVKYAREDLVYEAADAIVFDGGLIYNTGFKSIVIGASLRNFGPEIKFIDRGYPLPQTLTLGVSTILLGGTDPLITDMGSHSFLIAYDMQQPRDYDQQHILGAEYSFDQLLYLRGGFKFNGDQEGLSLGAGFKINNYKIDYAYSDMGEFLGSAHRITIGINIE